MSIQFNNDLTDTKATRIMCQHGAVIEGNDVYGKLTHGNGAVYEGQFENGKKNGKGKLVWDNGSAYEGEFKEDLVHGYGKLMYASGGIYEGEFKNNERHG